ncbi:MAG TPA: hypothetical protein VGF20_03575 [Candidatus Acidoferrum sp.]|jgi:hypothetical protein
MIIVAKLALGLASTMVFATVYTFREGVIRVDVDEHHEGGSHVHVWVPAAAVPMAMHFVPREHLREASSKASEFMPLVKIVTAELRRYPDTTFVEVQDGKDHVRVATAGSKLQIDVVSDEENVHVAVPLSTVDDVARQLTDDAPGI